MEKSFKNQLGTGSSSQLSSSQDPLVFQQQQQQQQQAQNIMRNLLSAPPPLPPRPAGNNVNMSYRHVPHGNFSYNIPYNRTFGSTYSPFGAFGGFGGYGYPNSYPGFNNVNSPENAFIRLAEESSRPAFQSIESLVNAVGSISMMLESTYHAVYNSYRAVLGVVENFSRLKSQLTHVLSTLALIRTLQWLLYRLLYFLRLRKTDPAAEAAWSAAADAALRPIADAAGNDAYHSIWPMVVFLSLVFGAPWLLFRIFSKMATKKLRNDEGYYAVVQYDFRASQPGELSIQPGQQLVLAPKSIQPKIKGWLLVTADNHSYGLVPANYVRVFHKGGAKKTAPAHAVQAQAAKPSQVASAPQLVEDLTTPKVAAVNGTPVVEAPVEVE